jgi:hypothetical protein
MNQAFTKMLLIAADAYDDGLAGFSEAAPILSPFSSG